MKKIVILVIGLLAAAPALFAQKAGRIDTASHPSLYTCPMHDSILLDKPGNCPICGMKLEFSKKEQMKKEVVKNYSCPVHIDVMSHDPGKCPKCGMDLVAAKETVHTTTTKTSQSVTAPKSKYVCTMDGATSDKPGKCPKCGMALVERKNDKK